VRPGLLARATAQVPGGKVPKAAKAAMRERLSLPKFGLQQVRLLHAPAEASQPEDSAPIETLILVLPSPSGRCRFTVCSFVTRSALALMHVQIDQLDEYFGAVKSTLVSLDRGELDTSAFLPITITAESQEMMPGA
jgi:hypothetical protein